MIGPVSNPPARLSAIGCAGGRGRAGAARRGMVLIVVLIAVMMVALAGYRFAEYMFIENKAVQQSGDALQAQHAVGSGEELLHVFLEQPRAVRQSGAGTLDNRGLFRGVLVRDDPLPWHRCRFSVVSPRVQEGQPTSVRFGLENESARLNLTVLIDWDQRHPGSAREALMNLPGMTVEVADAMLDWIDADDVSREYGAEDEYYAGMKPPYPPRNGPPETIEELLLVRGVTRGLLCGTDSRVDPRGAAGPSAGVPRGAQLANLASAPTLPWAALLTLYSAERNVDAQGQPRVHLNDVKLVQLYQRLVEALGQPWADFVVAYRQYGPYQGDEPAVAGATFAFDPAVPGPFPVESILDLLGAKVRLPARSGQPATILASPLGDEPDRMREELPRLMDRLTITAAVTITGRINVNLAPEPVLRAVPGLDETIAARIVGRRTNSPESAEQPDHEDAVWLLTEGLVDRAQMRGLMPYLTAGGDVFRGQIIGFFDAAGPTARVEVVVDAASQPSQLVYRKDLGKFGTGYSRALLGASGEAPGELGSTHRGAAGPAGRATGA